MSSYASEYPPNVEVDQSIKTFFENFYKISDNPQGHEEYAEQFTPDGVMIMGSKKVSGKSEIIATRQGMWEKVATRHHQPLKVFPFGPNPNEVMLFGVVDYGLKDGNKASVEWGARAHLVKDQGGIKMDFYQVYLDTAPLR